MTCASRFGGFFISRLAVCGLFFVCAKQGKYIRALLDISIHSRIVRSIPQHHSRRRIGALKREQRTSNPVMSRRTVGQGRK